MITKEGLGLKLLTMNEKVALLIPNVVVYQHYYNIITVFELSSSNSKIPAETIVVVDLVMKMAIL